MYSASSLRKGLKIEIDGEPYEIVDFQFSKPGKGQALYRCKLKNLLTGATFDKTYRSVDKVDKPDLHQRDMIYSYPQGDLFVFMDEETYEQAELGEDVVGEKKYFLDEEMQVKILFHNGRPIEIELPFFIEMRVAETEPGVRGDTATNTLKPAKLANGYDVQVPLFINENDVVKIDTRTGDYNGRVNKA